MLCPRTQPEVDAYLDGELSAIESAAFESHLQTCADCQAVRDQNLSLQNALQDRSLYFRAPRSLVEQIEASIADASPHAANREIGAWPRWTFALTALAACLAIAIVIIRSNTSADNQLAQEIVSDHIRSMMAAHIFDVESLDRHTVKPWFDGKIDFAPPVIDTKDKGFPLIGGRLDYAANQPVAALVFKRQQHLINLFIWPATGTTDAESKSLSLQGYNLVHWTQSGMTFWAVSDLELAQLQEFQKAQLER